MLPRKTCNGRSIAVSSPHGTNCTGGQTRTGMMFAPLAVVFPLLKRLVLVDRTRHCVFHRPARPQPIPQRLGRNTQVFSPCGEGPSTAERRDLLRPRCVSGLLLWRRPTDIPRLVVPLVVDTVQGVTRAGPRPHIREKPIEVLPLRTDRNTPRVQMKTLIPRLRAAPPHSHPDPIFGHVATRSLPRALTHLTFGQIARRNPPDPSTTLVGEEPDRADLDTTVQERRGKNNTERRVSCFP